MSLENSPTGIKQSPECGIGGRPPPEGGPGPIDQLIRGRMRSL